MFSLSFQRRTADDPSGCTHRPWSANLAMVASPWEVRPRLNWNLQSQLNIERTTTWFMGTRFLWTMPFRMAHGAHIKGMVAHHMPASTPTCEQVQHHNCQMILFTVNCCSHSFNWLGLFVFFNMIHDCGVLCNDCDVCWRHSK